MSTDTPPSSGKFRHSSSSSASRNANLNPIAPIPPQISHSNNLPPGYAIDPTKIPPLPPSHPSVLGSHLKFLEDPDPGKILSIPSPLPPLTADELDNTDDSGVWRRAAADEEDSDVEPAEVGEAEDVDWFVLYEPCTRVIAKERGDYWEFVWCNIFFAVVSVSLLYARKHELARRQFATLAARIGIPDDLHHQV